MPEDLFQPPNHKLAMQCASGLYLDFAKPTPAMIKIEDIAEQASKVCRYNGACQGFLSVTEHVCNVAAEVRGDIWLQLHAIAHDFHEAYANDLTRGLKMLVGPAYIAICNDLDAVIFEALGLPPLTAEMKAEIKRADNAVLRAESEARMPTKGKDWEWGEVVAANLRFGCGREWPEAKELFLDNWSHLIEKAKAERAAATIR